MFDSLSLSRTLLIPSAQLPHPLPLAHRRPRPLLQPSLLSPKLPLCLRSASALPALPPHLYLYQCLLATLDDDGPIQLSQTDNPSTLQVATSVLLTGAIAVFLFRSLRRRAKRVKEMQFRSTGAKKSLKEEALESLKAITPAVVGANAPPSPLQALLGGFAAGVIALILYRFTTTIEAALNRQTMPTDFSVQQITITVRTIVNGVCYLATFIFGINAVGLILYSGQLAFSSVMQDFANNEEYVDGQKLDIRNEIENQNDDANSDEKV